MRLDLDTDLPKATRDSERPIVPEATLQRAKEALGRLGLQLELETQQVDGFLWLTRLRTDIDPWLPRWARSLRIGGKGPSRAQSQASCAMELVERLSLYRHLERQRGIQRVWDLRGQRWLNMDEGPEATNTACTAAGNAYEDALLHALHELVETRSHGANPWIPARVVPLEAFDLPRWVCDSFAAIMLPTDPPQLCHVLALRSPDDGRFDPDRPHRLIEAGGRLFASRWRPPPDHHSPNSGSAAGLDPEACTIRAIGEALQWDATLPSARRREAPASLPRCTSEELRDHSTDSITGDIRLLLDLLGPETFLGLVDVTDPLLGLPVVKLVSDYAPAQSFASRTNMGLFFELEGGDPVVGQQGA